MNYHIPPCKLPRSFIIQIVKKQQNRIYQRPKNPKHQEIAATLTTMIAKQAFIWDFGCGTAKSSQILAQANPDKLIIGVDQSLHRLTKSKKFIDQQALCQNANLILVRANIIDLIHCWQGPKAHAQYWLHPNPYPKAKQIKHRWPTNPIFAKAMALAQTTIMRTNWLSYAQNWATACTTLGLEPKLSIYHDLALSAFEQKYQAQNLRIYQVNVN